MALEVGAGSIQPLSTMRTVGKHGGSRETQRVRRQVKGAWSIGHCILGRSQRRTADKLGQQKKTKFFHREEMHNNELPSFCQIIR